MSSFSCVKRIMGCISCLGSNSGIKGWTIRGTAHLTFKRPYKLAYTLIQGGHLIRLRGHIRF